MAGGDGFSASPHHSSTNSTSYTATDSTNHPCGGYNINYSFNQPNWAKHPTINGGAKNASPFGEGNNNRGGRNIDRANVNILPCTASIQRTGDPDGDPMVASGDGRSGVVIAAADATSNDHDNCNNNQSNPSTLKTTSIVPSTGDEPLPSCDGKVRPEEHNRLNNNHIVPRIGDSERTSPALSSLPSPTNSTRSGTRTDADGSIGPDCTTTADTTTSDTVDQRLPVYV
uniref:Uncharacterized protein n=1 Tax=Anopheles farauti TaxID=69004 RepID=A0A182QW51_9DIPT